MHNLTIKIIFLILFFLSFATLANDKTTNFGLDLEDGSRYGYTFYSSLGGLDEADVGLLYYGFRF